MSAVLLGKMAKIHMIIRYTQPPSAVYRIISAKLESEGYRISHCDLNLGRLVAVKQMPNRWSKRTLVVWVRGDAEIADVSVGLHSPFLARFAWGRSRLLDAIRSIVGSDLPRNDSLV